MTDAEVTVASVHPPSLVPSFPLKRRLSAEDIAWCGIMKLKLSWYKALQCIHSEIHFPTKESEIWSTLNDTTQC